MRDHGIPQGSSSAGAEAPTSVRRRLVFFGSMLALVVGIPALAVITFVDLWGIHCLWTAARALGHELPAKAKLLTILVSHIVVPLLWCSAALVGATLHSARPLRLAARALLGFSVLWALALACVLALS